ncbi:MAG: TRAP transporter large permease subunit, partial [Campylobacterota bacterium]
MKSKLIRVFFVSLIFAIVSFAQDSVTMYIDEVQENKQEDSFFLTVYGSSEAEDFSNHKWRIVDVTLSDSSGNSINEIVETDKRGMWEIQNLDATKFSDGEIAIEAVMKTEQDEVLATITHQTLKDTSFNLYEFMQNHLAGSIFALMVVLLLLGFPMKIPLIAGTTLGIYLLFNADFSKMEFLVQQMMAGIRPAALIAVPMFILSADIMTRGHSAEKLIDLVMAFVRHIKGGLAVSTAGACTMFGAVSGSTQATVVAVGS